MASWYQILTHFEYKGYAPNGLTIPFLIGCSTITNPSEAPMSIPEMLQEANEYGITLMECGNIGEYVIGTLDSDTLKMADMYKSFYKKVGNIVITDNSLPGINILDQLIACLEDLYIDDVSNAKYSWINGEFTEFSESDKTRINEVI